MTVYKGSDLRGVDLQMFNILQVLIITCMSVQCYHHGPHCGGPLAERHGRDKRASKLYTSYFYKFDDNGSRRQEEHRFCFNHYMEYHHGLTAIRQADGNYIYAPVEALEYIPTGLMKND